MQRRAEIDMQWRIALPVVQCLLLAIGSLIVALGGTLTRLGHQQYLYIAMSIGVALMFRGYLHTIAQPSGRTTHTPAGHDRSFAPAAIPTD